MAELTTRLTISARAQQALAELAKVTGLDVDFINVEIHKGQLRARVIEHDIIDIARLDAIAWLRRRQGLDAT